MRPVSECLSWWTVDCRVAGEIQSRCECSQWCQRHCSSRGLSVTETSSHSVLSRTGLYHVVMSHLCTYYRPRATYQLSQPQGLAQNYHSPFTFMCTKTICFDVCKLCSLSWWFQCRSQHYESSVVWVFKVFKPLTFLPLCMCKHRYKQIKCCFIAVYVDICTRYSHVSCSPQIIIK